LNDPNGNGLLGNLANFEILALWATTRSIWPAFWVHRREPDGSARLGPGTSGGWPAGAAVAVQGYHEVEHVLRLGQVVGWLSLGAHAWTRRR